MGVKAFNVTSLSKVRLMEPKDVGYQDSIDIIRDELHRTRRSFVKIGWYLKHIKDEEMFREDGYADIFELAMDKFSISQPTANRFMNICREFSVDHDSPELDEKFLDFSVSQLFEMLPMAEEKREQITPDMTVKQIREIKEDKGKKKEPDDGETSDLADDNEIPGQTSFEKDFPEYLPADQQVDAPQEEEPPALKEIIAVEGMDEAEIIEPEILDGEYREISPSECMNEKMPEEEPQEDLCETCAHKGECEGKKTHDSGCMGYEQMEESEDPQPELPALKNNDQRKEWLANYKAWGLWYYDEHIDVNYYKYDFPDGSRLIVAEYPQRESYWSETTADEFRYHLLKKGKSKYGSSQTYDEKYRHDTDSETSLIEFLKHLQK